LEVGNPIWNTFLYYIFFQISTDFKIFKRFRVKSGLTDLCSYRLIATSIANPGELHFREGVHRDDLQEFQYHKADMHTQYLQIEEDIENPKVLSAKKKPENA
jgi:hypothetical protein